MNEITQCSCTQNLALPNLDKWQITDSLRRSQAGARDGEAPAVYAVACPSQRGHPQSLALCTYLSQ